MPLQALVRIDFRTHLYTTELNDQRVSSEGEEEGTLPHAHEKKHLNI